VSVLVVAAHPDDEVLGCGGTVSGLTEPVDIAILGEGITSRYTDRAEADQRQIAALHAKAQEAGDLLGARSVRLFSLPDNRFDTLPLLDVVKIIEDLVAELAPRTIYTHHAGDLNIDHTVIHRAVLTATRPLPDCPVKDIYAFEVPSSTEWAFQRLERPFTPNVFVNIGDRIDAKVNAMECYEGEARPFPHPRSPDALRAIARRWGTVVGCDSAEAFELVRSVR
jgi:LmbE family N-acetylglucosaminyl deacetylase